MTIDTFVGSWTDRDLVSRIDQLPHFRSLVIYGPGFTDHGASLLARCKKLRELHLVDTRISNEGLKHIGKIQSLDWLVIDNAEVNNDGLQQLSDLKDLDGIQICSTKADDEGLAVLLHMPALCYLQAVGQDLGNTGLSLISQLPSLLSLRLASNTADDRDFLNLAFSRSLQTLTYDMPLVSQSAIDEMQSRLKNCELLPFRFYQPEQRMSYLSAYCLGLYERREFDLARLAADDVLKWFPFNPAAHGARAFINFQLGNFMDFRRDLENFRDNAELLGETELCSIAKYYLTLESSKAIRVVMEHSRPDTLLLERLRDTTRGASTSAKPAVSSLIQRFGSAANKTGDSIIHIPSEEDLAHVYRMQRETNEFINRILQRKKRDNDPAVPWSW